MKESEFERRFLEFVYTTDTPISPAALSYYTGVTIDEADEHLRKLGAKGVLRIDFDDAGDLHYVFPNRQRVTLPAPPSPDPLPSAPAGDRAGPTALVAAPATAVPAPAAAPQTGPFVRVTVDAPGPPLEPTQEANPDGTVPCPYCAEPIRPAAKKCRHCGEMLDANLRAARAPVQVNVGLQGMGPPPMPVPYYPPPVPAYPPVQRYSSGAAALLSLLWPGAGHIYCGKVGTGIGWMAATFVGYILLIIPGIVLHVCCMISAANAANEPRPF